MWYLSKGDGAHGRRGVDSRAGKVGDGNARTALFGRIANPPESREDKRRGGIVKEE